MNDDNPQRKPSRHDEATAWFNQFPEAPDWPDGGQWCARHWAPCPLLGANGIGAATELMSVFINEIAAPGSADELNAQLETAGRLCCTLGDERMYDLWGCWPPESAGTR
jgi:hypothetical protein